LESKKSRRCGDKKNKNILIGEKNPMVIELSNDQKQTVLGLTCQIYHLVNHVFMRKSPLERKREHFFVLAMDADNRPVCLEEIRLSTSDDAEIDPMQFFRYPLYQCATKAVLIHNHPYGTIKPTREDYDLTNFLLQAGKVLGIDVVDHLIISNHDIFYSFENWGKIKLLNKKPLFKLTRSEKSNLRREALDISRKNGNIKVISKEKSRKATDRFIA